MKGKDTLSLEGHCILVTGVSRSLGIGIAIAKRLAGAGAQVAAHGFAEYDREMGYVDAHTASDCPDIEGVFWLPSSDLSADGEAERTVERAKDVLGRLDGLILNHAYSTHCEIGGWTAEHIDRHMAVNVRTSMLMIQKFAETAQGGCITLMTSGQYQGPMTGEIAYALSKEAIRCLSSQASSLLAPRGIRVNCVNPGPNDTGYLEGEAYDAVARCFPSGRWGTPNDAAKLIHFLHSEQASWITRQTIASEGGFAGGGGR